MQTGQLIVLVLLIVVIAILVYNLTKTSTPDCVTDADCADTQVCTDGVCVDKTCTVTPVSFGLGVTEANAEGGTLFAGVQSDGRIVFITNQSIARLNNDYTRDYTFGTPDLGYTQFPAGAVQYLLVDQDDYIWMQIGTNLYRYTPNGVLDADFGTAGVLDVGYNGIRDATFDDGNLYIFKQNSGTNNIIIKVTPAGVIDATYTANSTTTIDTTFGAKLTGNDVAIEFYQNKCYIVTRNDIIAETELIAGRLLADGTADTTYGTGGFTLIALGDFPVLAEGTGFAVWNQSTVMPDGSLTIIGLIAVPAEPFNKFFMIKLTPAGVVDTTFGTDGAALVEFPLLPDVIEWSVIGFYASIYDPINDVFFVGTTNFDSPPNNKSYIVALRGDGTLDTERTRTVAPSYDTAGFLASYGKFYYLGGAISFNAFILAFECEAFNWTNSHRPW